jgi:hypothetical protein
MAPPWQDFFFLIAFELVGSSPFERRAKDRPKSDPSEKIFSRSTFAKRDASTFQNIIIDSAKQLRK